MDRKIDQIFADNLSSRPNERFDGFDISLATCYSILVLILTTILMQQFLSEFIAG